MSWLKKIIRTNKTMTEIIIIMVGLGLIALGKIKGPSVAAEISFGVGTSMLASAIVVFMTDAFVGGDDIEQIRKYGLETVYKTRGEMNGSCDHYLQKAKYVKAIAFGMRSMRASQTKAIERILSEGGSVQIITMKPYCSNLKAREKDELAAEDEISNTINQLIEWAKSINAKNYRGKLEIRYHEAQPQSFVFLMDNRLFTGPYEYAKSSQQSISFEYNNSGTAYEYYSEMFNDLWTNHDFCKNALS